MMVRMKFLIFYITIFSIAFSSFAQEWLQYIPEPDNNYFALVMDRSGSMDGRPLADAKEAAGQFIEQMNEDDFAALISFESNVHYDLEFTNRKDLLLSSVNSMRAGGSTALYDAVAKAAQILRHKQGTRVILFLTDGNDNGSRLNAKDIRRMNIGEGILVYGIGLGNLNHQIIETLADSTNGIYKTTIDSAELLTLYNEIQQYHYGLDRSGMGGLTVTSLPAGIPVRINNQLIGNTPIMLPAREMGDLQLEILFTKKVWSESIEIKEGQRAIVRAREDQLMPDLIIETAPLNSAVFIDDAYMGLSSMFPSQGSDHSNQLLIENIPPGPHSVRIVAVPDADLGTAQEFSFDLNMENMTAYLNVAVFMKRATLVYNNGKREQISSDPMMDIQDRLDRFDSLFGN